MEIESKPLKPFARSEREQIREHFAMRAGEAPIPNPFDPESMRRWDEYVQEMRELEQQLQEAGAMSYPKYSWVGNRIAEADMAVLYKLKMQSKRPITAMVAEAVSQYLQSKGVGHDEDKL